jgi:hypothetical protein
VHVMGRRYLQTVPWLGSDAGTHWPLQHWLGVPHVKYVPPLLAGLGAQTHTPPEQKVQHCRRGSLPSPHAAPTGRQHRSKPPGTDSVNLMLGATHTPAMSTDALGTALELHPTEAQTSSIAMSAARIQ